MLIITIFLIFVGIIYFYLKHSWLYWKRRNVECPPVTFPFGNAQRVLFRKILYGEEIARIYTELRSKRLRYGGFYFFTTPILIVADLDLIKAIMTKDFQHFSDHGEYINEEVDPLSGNLFGLKGQKWKSVRAKLTPTFTSKNMKLMFQTIADCSHGLTEVMDNCNNAVDIKDVVARFTTDVIGSCAFGIECNSLRNPDSEFRTYGIKIFEFGLANGLIGLTPKEASKFFLNIVNETVTHREVNNITRQDFMHLLIQLKNNAQIPEDSAETTGTTFSMNEVAAHAFFFFLGGFETSATTLTFCLYELATNLEIQQKLRDEINGILAKHNLKITYDALKEMVYMEKCINETLRKFPPGALLNRECTKTYKVPDSDLVIEKGTQVFIPLLGIHRDPEYYDDPLTFDPERFAPENKSKRKNDAWLPFGEGPRKCIGIGFAFNQIKVALTVLLKNYKYTLNPKTKLPIEFNVGGLLLSVKGGVWLDVEKIEDQY